MFTKTLRAGTAIHLFVMCLLALVGHYVGTDVADFIYFDLLKLRDPYFGPTARRMMITSVSQAAAICLLIFAYGEILNVGKRFRHFAVISLLASASVAFAHIRIVGGFSIRDSYWLYAFGLYVLVFIICTTVFYRLKRGSGNSTRI